MKFNVSPVSAIRCIKISVGPILCWPPPRSASKSDLIIRDVLLLLTSICPLSSNIILPWNIYRSLDDAEKATKELCILMALFGTVIKMSIFRYHRDKFQIYYGEMEEFVKLADARERAILERHMDKCGPFYACIGLFDIITLVLFCCAPIVLSQPFPADADFPFSYEDSQILFVLLYIEEVWLVIQAFSCVIVDMEIAMLLWFYGIRFELLAEEFRTVASLSDFNTCVKKHQELLTSTSEVISTLRYIIVVVTAVTTVANICTGYQLVHHQPIAVLAQFFSLMVVSCMEVLMYAWPADNLMATSEGIVHAVYDSNWTGQSSEMLKSIQIVMMRAQRPLIISVGGFLPKLDLHFYGRYLSASFSYFTTLQAVVE